MRVLSIRRKLGAGVSSKRRWSRSSTNVSEGANTSVSDVTVDSRFPQFPELSSRRKRAQFSRPCDMRFKKINQFVFHHWGLARSPSTSPQGIVCIFTNFGKTATFV